MEIVTARLLLRSWRASDLAPFAAMGADAEVMRFFAKLLTPEESAAAIRRFQACEAADGFCVWAAERRSDGAFIGFVGIQRIVYTAHFTPAVEVGWRLARTYWGEGLATEAASASLDFGFNTCGLREIVAVAVPENTRSLAVMARLGMTQDLNGAFDHPDLPDGHALRRHVLYRCAAGTWREGGPD